MENGKTNKPSTILDIEFNNIMSRKPLKWSLANSINFEELKDSVKNAINKLSVHKIEIPSMPCEDLPLNIVIEDLSENDFWGVLIDKETGISYLIDTEGHSYARYVLQLQNMPY